MLQNHCHFIIVMTTHAQISTKHTKIHHIYDMTWHYTWQYDMIWHMTWHGMTLYMTMTWYMTYDIAWLDITHDMTWNYRWHDIVWHDIPCRSRSTWHIIWHDTTQHDMNLQMKIEKHPPCQQCFTLEMCPN